MVLCVLLAWLWQSVPVRIAFCHFLGCVAARHHYEYTIVATEYEVVHSHKIVSIIKLTSKVFHNSSKRSAHHTDLLQGTPQATLRSLPHDRYCCKQQLLCLSLYYLRVSKSESYESFCYHESRDNETRNN